MDFDNFMASPQVEEDAEFYFYGDYPLDIEDEYEYSLTSSENSPSKNLTF